MERGRFAPQCLGWRSCLAGSARVAAAPRKRRRRTDAGGARKAIAPAGAVILAAGDIACSGCAQHKTATLLADLSAGGRTAAILPLGDQAYSDGSLSDYDANYAPSWGVPDLLALSHPVPGNHEYGETKGEGYFDYFNGVGAATGIAGTRGQGYYSFDVGAWHSWR